MKKEKLLQKNRDQYIVDTGHPFYYDTDERPENPINHSIWFNDKTDEWEHYSAVDGNWTLAKYA